MDTFIWNRWDYSRSLDKSAWNFSRSLLCPVDWSNSRSHVTGFCVECPAFGSSSLVRTGGSLICMRNWSLWKSGMRVNDDIATFKIYTYIVYK